MGHVSDQSRGWDRADETWNFMDALKLLDGEAWFALGDRDLALHVERARRVAAGERLTSVICRGGRRASRRTPCWRRSDTVFRKYFSAILWLQDNFSQSEPSRQDGELDRSLSEGC
jgi:LPPG:FO 2-phospho-L-lactate transferase